ncbi:MAG: hypothetical protein GWN01_15370, partial [Nitrosopumilaceae archaeon]|nr:hypothetical protein [Nitrosopumilaceae archaeon]NIU87506.1 hypothetical protein [Nitrosopumilaceae archaeon]NIX62823.1 hypothetical protein [Nitrosopumilaceae archaeon]
MPSNRIVNTNRTNSGKGNVTSIDRSQRSTCNIVIYRWDDTDITKLNSIDANGEKGYEGRGQGSISGNFNQRSRVVIKNDVVRANISKNKSSNAGTFSINLKKGKQVIRNQVQKEDIDYLDVIHPGDWVMIYIKKGGEVDVNSLNQASGFKCLGIVKNVRYVEVDDPETGKPRLEYVVTGEDFGSVFNMDVFFNPLLNQDAAQLLLGAKFLTDSLDSVKGTDRPSPETGGGFTPDSIIKKMIGFYLGGSRGDSNLDSLNITNQTWYVPPLLGQTFGSRIRNKSQGVSFVDILKTDRIGLHSYNRNGSFRGTKPLPGATFIKALPSSGSVWQIMSTMQNSIANEMFTELVADEDGNLRPSVVLRQVPFSNRPGETNVFSTADRYNSNNAKEVPESFQKTYLVDLPRHSIVSSDIKNKNVGKSEHERINHVLVVPKIDVNAINQAYTAITNTPSIQRYGLKSYQGQTQYVADTRLGDPKKACKFFAHLLVDWFFLSHQFYNGTITIDGKDNHFQIGNNLYISDVGQLYHIEGYTHTFINNPEGSTEFTTELTVSRGQVFQNNQSKFIGPSRFKSEPTTV